MFQFDEQRDFMFRVGEINIHVRDTRGASDCQYIATSVDPVGMGWGNTKEQTLRSFCRNLRGIANRIEEEIVRQG